MTLRITTWNVNGIRNPFSYRPWSETKKFETMFEILGADIVCMQETKIQKKDLSDDMVLVPGWDSYFTFPVHKKGYSGVAVYTRNSKCQPIKAEEGITGILEPPAYPGETYKTIPAQDSIGGYPEMTKEEALLLDSEGRALVIDFGAFVLIGTYCPAATDPARDGFRADFVRALDERVRRLVTEMGRRVVVVGDLNIAKDEIDSAAAKEIMKQQDLQNWRDPIKRPTRHILHKLLVPQPEGVMVDLCREFFPDRTGMYTCWDVKMNCRPGNHGQRIDYVLSSCDMKPWFFEANIQEGLMGSDHCPVYATINETIEVDGEAKNILDLVNPPGTFEGGKRQTAVPFPSKPRLCRKTFSEYAGRQNIRAMFSKMIKSPAPDASATTSTPLSPQVPKMAVKTATKVSPPPAKRQKRAPSSLQRSSSQKKPPAPSQGQKSLKGFFKPSQRVVEKKPEQIEESSVSGTQEDPEVPDASPKLTVDFSQTLTVNSSQTTLEEGEDEATPTASASTIPEDVFVIDPIESKEKWSNIFTKRRPPKCDVHNEDCIQLVAKKPGINCGRAFWLCPRPLGPGGKEAMLNSRNEWRCNYFKWSSDWSGT